MIYKNRVRYTNKKIVNKIYSDIYALYPEIIKCQDLDSSSFLQFFVPVCGGVVSEELEYLTETYPNVFFLHSCYHYYRKDSEKLCHICCWNK